MHGRRRRPTLNANTTYTLLFTSPGGDHLQLVSTPLNREDTGGAAGWSIADESHFKTTSNVWEPTITRLAFRVTIRGTTTSTDTAPRVETAIPDQTATVGTAFRYAFPDNTFSDLDGDTLAYAATKADGAVLPTWLTFTDATRTFSGTPQAADVATVSVKVTASDGNSGSVSNTFDIAINNRPTASNGEVTTTEDTDYTFTAANFNFSDTDAGDVLSSVKITSLPAAGTLQVDGTAMTSATSRARSSGAGGAQGR